MVVLLTFYIKTFLKKRFYVVSYEIIYNYLYLTVSKTKKQKIGKIGEDLSCKFLVKHGFLIHERNYWKKCGEIDIIAKKDNTIHFVEVKTVSCLLNTKNIDIYNPEDNVHKWKLKRLFKTIQIYLSENNISENTEWRLDVAVVFLDFNLKKAKVRFIDNVIL